MSVENIGESDGNSDCVESAKKSPTSPVNTPYLVGHISELEEMHEVVECEIIELARPTVNFSSLDELKIQELDNDETNQLENHQDNGTTPPVNTQTYPLHSPLEDALVDSAAPPPCQHIKAGNTSLEAQ